ncbi:hypothetical protein [Saccharopolyspora spinosa]|uniref:hypothetical protein n=1 Tax=Saccharopolyspora spinosa TaxID=60894 RepID=UPI0011D1FCC5|nr:hypothetical protein [Saccharopolyspora spinosa]
MGKLVSRQDIMEAADRVPYPAGMPPVTVVGARRAQDLLTQVNRLSDERDEHDDQGFVALSRLVTYEAASVEETEGATRERRDWALVGYARDLSLITGTLREGWSIQSGLAGGAGPAQPSDVDSARVPFGELMPLRPPVDAWTGSELRGGETEYVQGGLRGPLPDVVDGRRVVLNAAELAGVSGDVRAALDAFSAATGVAARPRLADVDEYNVVAFLRMLNWWGVVNHALVVKKRKTTWLHVRRSRLDREGLLPELVEEGTDVWYVMGEYAQGAKADSAKRPDDLWDLLTERPPGELGEVPPHLGPNRVLPPDTVLWKIAESVEFFLHVMDPAGVRVEYGLADQGLWLRGREVEWGELFGALKDEGPAELMSMVNPGVHRNRYLAQAWGVDETTARVWRMWSHLPIEWHAEALRRAITGSVVSTYGGREAVKTLVETLVPGSARYQERLRALGKIMMRLADRRRRLESWGEEARDAPSAAEYRRELQQAVAEVGGLDQVVLAESKPDIQVPGLPGPAPQGAGVQGRQASPRELSVLHELAHALDGRELEYLRRLISEHGDVSQAVGVFRNESNWRDRPGSRAVVRGVVLDTIVEAGAVAVADRLRELGRMRGVQVASQGRPEGASTAAREVFSLQTTQEWWAWTLSDLVEYVAGDAVPAEVPDEELVRHLGPARAALVTRVPESTAQAWLDGSRQPDGFDRDLMRGAGRLSGSELVRYLGPGRAQEVVPVDEWRVWRWLGGFIEPSVGEAAKLRQAVLRAITDGLLPSKPLRRGGVVGVGLREAERRLAWADATNGGEFPSDARSQWLKVDNPDPPLRPASREVIDGLGESLKASVNYIVVQVLLGNEDARAMLEGSGIVIPGPGPGAATGLLEQIADRLRAARGMLDSGVLRRLFCGLSRTSSGSGQSR